MISIGEENADRLERFLGAVAFDRRWAVRRDGLAVSLGLCGLRWEEVSRVRLRHVEVSSGRLLVESAKGGLRRVLPLGADLLGRMVELFAKRPALCRGEAVRDGFVFVTRLGKQLCYEAIRRRLRQWTSEVLGREYSFHCLRHTAAVRVYEATKDVLAVQRFLGHRSLAWTETYLRSLLTVDLAGLPGFCSGRPGLRVVTNEEIDCVDEKGKEMAGKVAKKVGGNGKETVGQVREKRAENVERANDRPNRASADSRGPDPRADQRTGRATVGSVVGTGSVFAEVEGPASVSVAVDHDCLAEWKRVVDPRDSGYWLVTCGVCGRFLGRDRVTTGAGRAALAGQRSLLPT